LCPWQALDNDIQIGLNPALASIQFAGGTAGGSFDINQNAVLSSLSGPFSSVGFNLEVIQNPNLSTAAATTWGAQVSVGGVKEFDQNKVP
jgi:hypothetical protein